MEDLEVVADEIWQLRTHQRGRSAELFTNVWPRSEDGTGGRQLRERRRLHVWVASRPGCRKAACWACRVFWLEDAARNQARNPSGRWV